jgi:hypothetical protein
MPEECERVASRAREKLLSYYDSNGFLDAVYKLLGQLGINSGGVDHEGSGK